ncbi:MAG TPA: hypothetical protein VFI22_05090, partial [Thermomicrobiales bacterium]|nr:hypothetical protein [Thermomicrobiales bacterium]
VLARPASVAAARFLGIEHLWAARIARILPDAVEAEAAGAMGPVRILATVVPGAAPGLQATLAVRAATVSLLPCDGAPPQGWNAVPGRVTAVAAAPWGWRVALRGPLMLEAHVAGGAPPAIGEERVAAFPPSAVHLIPDV